MKTDLIVQHVDARLLVDVEAEVLRVVHGATDARASSLARGGARRRLVVVRSKQKNSKQKNRGVTKESSKQKK
jgi:hypothetical protein